MLSSQTLLCQPQFIPVFAGINHGLYRFSHRPGKNTFCHDKNPTLHCGKYDMCRDVMEFMKIRICRMRILMYKSVRMRMQILKKKLKYDTINTDKMMQSTNIT